MKFYIDRASNKDLKYKKNKIDVAKQDEDGNWYVNITKPEELLEIMKQTKCQLVIGGYHDNEPYIIVYDDYLE